MTSDSADRTPSEHDPQAPEATPRPSGAAQQQGEVEQSEVERHEPERFELEPHEPEQHEDFGPLELLRTRKADGRALLLFSHRSTERER